MISRSNFRPFYSRTLFGWLRDFFFNTFMKFSSKSTFLQRQKHFVKNFYQSYQIYQNVLAFIIFILTYWYCVSVESFKSIDGFFKDLQNWRFCENFRVNRLFCSAKNILSKIFVRATKCTKMFGLLPSLFWHIDNENLLSRLKAVMVSLKTSKTEDYFF